MSSSSPLDTADNPNPSSSNERRPGPTDVQTAFEMSTTEPSEEALLMEDEQESGAMSSHDAP